MNDDTWCRLWHFLGPSRGFFLSLIPSHPGLSHDGKNFYPASHPIPSRGMQKNFHPASDPIPSRGIPETFLSRISSRHRAIQNKLILIYLGRLRGVETLFERCIYTGVRLRGLRLGVSERGKRRKARSSLESTAAGITKRDIPTSINDDGPHDVCDMMFSALLISLIVMQNKYMLKRSKRNKNIV